MLESRRTSIVIQTYNNLQNNIICLESIRDYTSSDTYEIVVVDNNSTDGTKEWLKQQWDVKLLLNDEKVGCSKGYNMGIELADKENDILLLSNDVKVTPRWLNNLKVCLYSDNSIGAVSSVTNNCTNYQGITVQYKDMDDMIDFAFRNNVSMPKMWQQSPKLSCVCMLIKKEVINKLGFLDENFTLDNFINNDLSMRIISEGYKLMLCNDSFIHKFGDLSFNCDSAGSNSTLKVNKQKFQEKWGFNSSLCGEIKTDIIKFINEPRDRELNILEFHCNLGDTLLSLKNKYANAKLYGIETNESAAQICGKMFEVTTENFESNYTLDFQESKEDFFDYIILGKALQNCKDPWKFLRGVKRFLKPGGYVMATLPNAMNYSIIRDLINGKFVYSEKSHLNRSCNWYFTSRDIESISEECGYVNPRITNNTVQVSDEDNEFLKDICTLAGADIKEKLIPKEFIVKLQKDINDVPLSHEDTLVEVKYALRRVENDIDKNKNLGFIKDYYEREKISLFEINKIIASEIINKDEVEAIILSYLE